MGAQEDAAEAMDSANAGRSLVVGGRARGIEVNYVRAVAENIERQSRILITRLSEEKNPVVDAAQNIQDFAKRIITECNKGE